MSVHSFGEILSLDLTSLQSAAFPIFYHALAAVAALIIGAVQLLRRKGGKGHRVLGWIWVLLMGGTAVSAVFISEIKPFGWYFSPIHLLIIVTGVSLFLAVRAAKKGQIQRHKRIMVLLYVLALVVTGAFTLLPGRAMHAVLFKNPADVSQVNETQ